MQGAFHADRIAVGPPLEIVENGSLDRGALSIRVTASHEEKIRCSRVDRRPDRQSRIVTIEIEPNRRPLDGADLLDELRQFGEHAPELSRDELEERIVLNGRRALVDVNHRSPLCLADNGGDQEGDAEPADVHTLDPPIINSPRQGRSGTFAHGQAGQFAGRCAGTFGFAACGTPRYVA